MIHTTLHRAQYGDQVFADFRYRRTPFRFACGIVCTYSHGRDNNSQSITTVNTWTVPRWNKTIACILER
jgi:hypothetical protein